MKRYWNNVDTGYSEKDYFDFLKDKTVALVGASSSLYKQKQGKKIDSFDVVVRMNLGIPIPANSEIDLGARIDVLYCVMSKVINDNIVQQWKDHNIKWLIGTNNKRNRVKGLIPLIDFPWIVLEDSFMNSINDHIKGLPNTGLITIVHLLKAPISNLTLFGIDFYSNKYYPGFLPYDRFNEKMFLSAFRNNDMPSQILYLFNIWEKDSRLIINKELKEIFEGLNGL